jgi:predicted MFS family arabinose efflux permease
MVPRRDAGGGDAEQRRFNIARSVGPAIGGAIVAAAGAVAAFAINAVSYIALLIVLTRWSRPSPSGCRARRSSRWRGHPLCRDVPNIRTVTLRAFVFGFGAIVGLALLPLIARDLVRGGPLTYGVLLGASAPARSAAPS